MQATTKRERDQQAIGRSVAEARERKALTQKELAEQIGSTQGSISRIENGHVYPEIDTLERIAAATGTNWKSFLP